MVFPFNKEKMAQGLIIPASIYDVTVFLHAEYISLLQGKILGPFVFIFYLH